MSRRLMCNVAGSWETRCLRQRREVLFTQTIPAKPPGVPGSASCLHFGLFCFSLVIKREKAHRCASRCGQSREKLQSLFSCLVILIWGFCFSNGFKSLIIRPLRATCQYLSCIYHCYGKRAQALTIPFSRVILS